MGTSSASAMLAAPPHESDSFKGAAPLPLTRLLAFSCRGRPDRIQCLASLYFSECLLLDPSTKARDGWPACMRRRRTLKTAPGSRGFVLSFLLIVPFPSTLKHSDPHCLKFPELVLWLFRPSPWHQEACCGRVSMRPTSQDPRRRGFRDLCPSSLKRRRR